MRLRGRILFMHGKPPRLAAIPGLFRTFAAETRYGNEKINVITLGCSKNTVDSEHLMARLAAAGYEVLFDSDRTDAKVVVINTCGFIGDAKQESVDMILRAAAAKTPARSSGCSSSAASRNAMPTPCAPNSPKWTGFRRPHMGWHRPGAGSRRRPGPGHRTAPLDAQALCLPENLGGLQLEMRLLRHPAHPRRARFRADGGAGGGGAQTRGRRREGTDRHCAGHDLLRARPLREAPPG